MKKNNHSPDIKGVDESAFDKPSNRELTSSGFESHTPNNQDALNSKEKAFKIIEERLKYDIKNNIGMNIKLGVLK